MIQVFGTEKCRATRAARRFFAERGVRVQFVDLRVKGLSAGELASVARAVGGVRGLYDPERDASVRFAAPTDAQLTRRLVEEPALLRTPIVRDGARAAVGSAEPFWRELADAARRG